MEQHNRGAFRRLRSTRIELVFSEWPTALRFAEEATSEGGLRLQRVPHEMGPREVQLSLRLPDGSKVELKASIQAAHDPDRLPAGGHGERELVIADEHQFDLRSLSEHAQGQVAEAGSAGEGLPEGHRELVALSYWSGDTEPERMVICLGAAGEAEPRPAQNVFLGTGDYELVDEPSAKRFQVDSDPIFGLDFGTSYSSIALVTAAGVHVLEDSAGRSLFPSMVSYTGREPVVGWPARELLSTHRESTFVSPKRLLGRQYDDPKIQPYLGATPVPTERGPNGQVLVRVDGEQLAVPQVCSEIFRRLARIGERSTGMPVERVVIALPVGYGPAEANAVKRAADLAGLKVVGMLKEPVAAAMAYGLGRAEGERIAIYDLGGGTFDCTLLEIRGGRFQILASAGDGWLGGDDFDLALANHVANAFWREHKVDLRKRAVEWQRVVLLCERAKRHLTENPSVELRARRIVEAAGREIDLRVVLDRSLFAALCRELVEQTIALMDRCLAKAGIRAGDLSHLVLTGGGSRSPLVREMLQEHFRCEPRLAPFPEQAIVAGNAVYGRFLRLTLGSSRTSDSP